MNFDELQKQWDNQSSDEVQINPALEVKKEANTVIDKVRKVMKKDFFFQLTIFPMLLIYPYLFRLNTPIVWWVLACIVVIMIVPLYYLIKFYNSSYKLEYNSLRSINWFYYNFKSSITIFSLYTYTLSILCILFIGTVLIEKQTYTHFDSLINFGIFYFIVLIIYIGFCIWILKWWIKKLYRKPLKELEEIVNQLEE